ncbi:MAG: hypothetical protein Q8L12_15315, partial [Methylibium sp.]|nr:hypothetical protein [Methylibium sp.]
MKKLLTVLALSVAALAAHAADATCEAKAAEKKLAGAAKTSFVKKCLEDSGSLSCDAKAVEKKLAGAAKTSFVTKCEKDAAAATSC